MYRLGGMCKVQLDINKSETNGRQRGREVGAIPEVCQGRHVAIWRAPSGGHAPQTDSRYHHRYTP